MNCERLRIGLLRPGLAILALAFLAAGCAHSRRGGEYAGAVEGVQAAKPPAFLTGPVGVLLTNSQDFSAKASFNQRMTPAAAKPVSGTLLIHGPKLLFALDSKGAPRRSFRRGGIIFVWDVAERKGFILSDALQAYAPITGTVEFTNIVRKTGLASAGARNVQGRRCDAAEAVVQASDGASATVHFWQAPELNGLPLRLETGSDSAPGILELSDVRATNLKDSLFSPPDGFSTYQNPESLVNEFMAREYNLRPKRQQAVAPDFQETPAGQPQPYRGPY